MSELTRVIEARITIINKLPDRDAEMVHSYKDEAAQHVAEKLRELYTADDVQVEIHDFILDKE
jgi:hypothetical protein